MENIICKICNAELKVFERKNNINGNINEIRICASCHVLSNVSVFPDNLDVEKEIQGGSSIEFYKIPDEEMINRNIQGNTEILNHFRPYLGNTSTKTFLEIGSGSGYMLIAAREYGFGKVRGVDFNTDTFEQLKKVYPVSDQVEFYGDFESIPQFDVLYLWHTLEHIYEPNEFFDTLDQNINSGCIILLQVPQYRQEYINDSHYHFYNENSIRVLLQQHRFEVQEIMYDHQLQFMTVIAKRA